MQIILNKHCIFVQMVRRCVVGGCSNVGSKTTALHKWPAEKYVAGKWNSFVKSTRVDFKGQHKAPVICSDHFVVSQHFTSTFSALRECNCPNGNKKLDSRK